MNDLQKYAEILSKVEPWSGRVPAGFVVDFLGQVTEKHFPDSAESADSGSDGTDADVPLPCIGTGADGEDFWFEAVDWLVAAREARDHFVMITLGAWNGHQAVGSYRALQKLNPMPCRLVAVEPVPDLMDWTRRHFRQNGIDPNEHWLIPMAISENNEPVFFTIAPPEMGPQNCFSTNELRAREDFYKQIVKSKKAESALNELLLRNSTGITVQGASDRHGRPLQAEIKLISAVTLSDVLGPFEAVDYLEADIQESEIVVFPPFMELLKRKVRRIHIGTHGRQVHQRLHDLFLRNGWEMIFSYEPDMIHRTIFGPFKTGDGVLTVRNPGM